MPFSISYTFNQENTENFILGRKPPQPNRERAETSWGRTGKGPKPLATNTKVNISLVNRIFLK